MEFYRNGKSFGTAFADVYEGTYYPAISLYKNASVRCNFGPTFKYPPTESDVRPMIEKSEEMLIEQTMADMLFFLENEGQLKLG
uniref:SPRY domain-containing protein n=1 Tax=Plectus sambesii TaxID=2011161 RepID=A0A914X1J7_9BILA